MACVYGGQLCRCGGRYEGSSPVLGQGLTGKDEESGCAEAAFGTGAAGASASAGGTEKSDHIGASAGSGIPYDGSEAHEYWPSILRCEEEEMGSAFGGRCLLLESLWARSRGPRVRARPNPAESR